MEQVSRGKSNFEHEWSFSSIISRARLFHPKLSSSLQLSLENFYDSIVQITENLEKQLTATQLMNPSSIYVLWRKQDNNSSRRRITQKWILSPGLMSEKLKSC